MCLIVLVFRVSRLRLLWVSLSSYLCCCSCCHLSGVLSWFQAVRRSVRSMCLHRHYPVLRCHLGQVFSLATGVPLVKESVFSFPLLTSQFHGFCDGAGRCFLLFHRPTLCVALAVFLSMILRDFSLGLPCPPSHVLRGHFGVWECVLVFVKRLHRGTLP